MTSQTADYIHMCLADRLRDIGGDMYSPYHPAQVAENLVFYLHHKYPGEMPTPNDIFFACVIKGDEKNREATQVQLAVVINWRGEFDVPVSVKGAKVDDVLLEFVKKVQELVEPLLEALVER